MGDKKIEIWHNARCSKSREAVNYLQEKAFEFETFEYLKEELTLEDLRGVLEKLNMQPAELLRTKEKVYQEQYADKKLSSEAIMKAMVKHPQLIERPIVVRNNKAVVARPLDKAIQFLAH
ncbi:MAG: arsenate reductase (glutaredoxin) [Crocinitomicaceae bacterium]|jgi:arsenate reductase|nr:arsenate reductase (glutaredoxin) [Crocinitomicaceae bacterium]